MRCFGLGIVIPTDRMHPTGTSAGAGFVRSGGIFREDPLTSLHSSRDDGGEESGRNDGWANGWNNEKGEMAGMKRMKTGGMMNV